MRNVITFSLPYERGVMLRDIASKLDKPIGDVVGDLILDHIARETIYDQTEGVHVSAGAGTIALRIVADDERTMDLSRMTATQARTVANAIETATSRPTPGGTHIDLGDERISIGRFAASVTIFQAMNGKRRVLAYSVARDVARQIRNEADKLDRQLAK